MLTTSLQPKPKQTTIAVSKHSPCLSDSNRGGSSIPGAVQGAGSNLRSYRDRSEGLLVDLMCLSQRAR